MNINQLFQYTLNNPILFVDPLGLSRLVFDRSDKTLYVYPGDNNTQGPPQKFNADNNARNLNGEPFAPGSLGPVPNGKFPVGNFKHTGDDPNSSFGNGFYGIKLPAIPLSPDVEGPWMQRQGVGIHSGRANQGGPSYGTNGCIRTTGPAINAMKNDPPTTITIQP